MAYSVTPSHLKSTVHTSLQQVAVGLRAPTDGHATQRGVRTHETKGFLLAVFFALVLVSVARADGVATDKLVLSDGSFAVTAGLNEWFLAGSQAIAPAVRWLVSVDIPNAF
jgi:hypothetical protein